jgi:ribosomal protein S18
MNYWKKDKRVGGGKFQKRRNNWDQGLRTSQNAIKTPKKIRKNLQYIMLLKKFNNIVDYKNLTLLKAFLTKYGKIRSRRKTRISIQQQKIVSKAIRRARATGIIPFTCDVKI